MSNLHIGLSGLDAAERAFDVIGNNIANAATPGYHRQRLELIPSYGINTGGMFIGGGVSVDSVRRMVDSLLDQEIYRQSSSLEQLDRELRSLHTVESTISEFGTSGGLNEAIDNFFTSWNELSAHPTESVWQNQMVSVTEIMTNQFRQIDGVLANISRNLRTEAEQLIEQVNEYSTVLAQLNTQISTLQLQGNTTGNLDDKRDLIISKMSELISVEVTEREYGVVDVVAGGQSVVTSSSTISLEVGLDENADLGVGIEGSYIYDSTVSGGQIGALLSLKNTLVSGVNDQLDTLALAIVENVNKYHTQGIGPNGSFNSLTGWATSVTDIADLGHTVTDGTLYVRVTNTSTGAVTRNAITIDASADSISDLATSLSAITGINASNTSAGFTITADTNYEFDFLPCVLPSPTVNGLTAASPPTVTSSGVFTGSANDTLTFTTSGAGAVGNGTLQLTVTNGDGDTIKVLDIGSGYVAGTKLDVGNGVKIALSAGDINAGDSFEVDVFADSDTSDILGALGLNTFFSGNSAGNIELSSRISDTPSNISTALEAEGTDNGNVLKMVGLQDETITDLSSFTIGDYYRKVVTDLGQEIATREITKDSTEAVVADLTNQQESVSGVDINEEAANLLLYQQMFQALSKYMGLVQSEISALMGIL